MLKRKSFAFNKDLYFLGTDENGVNYWLEAAKWNCGWYWGGGYVETYTSNDPERSRDINSHQHFDSLFFKGPECCKNEFDKMFVKSPFTDSEKWQICELMKSFYIARNYSDMLHSGGAHITTNPAKDTIQNQSEYDRINKIVIPEILEKLYEILGGPENVKY